MGALLSKVLPKRVKKTITDIIPDREDMQDIVEAVADFEEELKKD